MKPAAISLAFALVAATSSAIAQNLDADPSIAVMMRGQPPEKQCEIRALQLAYPAELRRCPEKGPVSPTCKLLVQSWLSTAKRLKAQCLASLRRR